MVVTHRPFSLMTRQLLGWFLAYLVASSEAISVHRRISHQFKQQVFVEQGSSAKEAIEAASMWSLFGSGTLFVIIAAPAAAAAAAALTMTMDGPQMKSKTCANFSGAQPASLLPNFEQHQSASDI